MLESGVGRAHNIALSTLANFSLPGDVSASKRYWKEDIIDPEVEVSAQGMIAISHEPGTGYHIKEDLIEKLTVAQRDAARRCIKIPILLSLVRFILGVDRLGTPILCQLYFFRF